MKTTITRRFTLFDVMVLIAATAVGIAWTAETAKDIVEFCSDPHYLRDVVDCLMQGLGLGLPLLLAWTVAILALRFRRPRPRRRLLWRQPGVMACAIVLISAAFCESWWQPTSCSMGFSMTTARPYGPTSERHPT